MTSSEIKQRAREALRGNWLSAVIAGIVASFLGASTMNNFVLNIDFNIDQSVPQPDSDNVATAFNMGADLGYNEAWSFLIAIVLGLLAVSFVYSLIMFTIGSAVSVGYSQYNLDLVDGCGVRVGTLFSCMSQMKTAIFVKLLTVVYVILGYILLIIPGIMATYSYSMANFVLADNPDMTAREALRESKRIMKGHRWRLFCLEMSFIGLVLISILTVGIGFIWSVPYMNASYAAFYREAKSESNFQV